MAGDDPSVVTQVQHLVYGSTCTLVLPMLLFLVSMVLLFYRGVTQEHTDMPLNGFLANILIQMMPLVALKAKIWTCADRVSLVPLVMARTLLMHVAIGGFRVASEVMDGFRYGTLIASVDIAALLFALALLKYEFEFSLNPMTWIMHADVRNLIGLSCAAAFITEVGFEFVPDSWMSDATRRYFRSPFDPSKLLFTAANYVDLVGFMPIVWRLYQAEQEHDDYNVGTTVSERSRRQIKWFFAFIFFFYGWDDVVDPCMGLLEEPLALMAHAAHFVLVLDFAGFFIFQVQQPSTTKELGMERGEQLQGLLSQEDDDPY